MSFECAVCGSKLGVRVPYLRNMSLVGRLFSWLPLVIVNFLPSARLRTRFIHGKNMIAIFGGRHWEYCVNCNFGSVTPTLHVEEIAEYYASSFWTTRAPEDVVTDANSEANKERPLRQLKFIRDCGITSVNSLIDFGGGVCGASQLFKNEGFVSDVAVVDPSFQAAEVSRLLHIRHETDLQDFEQNSVDMMYSSHSLEHVLDFKEVLEEFRRVVRPGGFVFIEVPNIANTTIFEQSHHAPHTYVFAKESLCLAMAQLDFELISFQTVGETFKTRIKSSNPELNEPCSLACLFRKIET